MTRLLDARLPIAAAPMAGGPSTPALAAAVASAGAYPMMAAGYLTTDAMAGQVEQLRGVGVPFGVNLFVPSPASARPDDLTAYADRLAPLAHRLDVALADPPMTDDDDWSAKVAWLIAHPVSVVTLTFGLPDDGAVNELQTVGTRVLASVTTPGEGRAAADLGVDGLVVQGTDAGGHSATHDPRRTPAPARTVDLIQAVAETVDLPIVAAGGVDGPGAVRDLIDAGAQTVSVGTLLLRTDEAGTSPTHRQALTDGERETVLTHAFTGRPARALRNSFVDEHGAHAPFAYPAVHHLTRPIRQAAAAKGDPEALHLWAGTGYRSAPEGPAADVIRWLASEL